ncbi:UPF0149 family protein [Ectothiorhodospiraceae bacterium 2226]|nr:UPF0149 family protein [Ectothiorhodospiraceae bacterium 2226]
MASTSPALRHRARVRHAAVDAGRLPDRARALNPDLIPPSEWLPWVWDMDEGEARPEFDSQEQAQAVLELIMRHYTDVAAAVIEGQADPLFVGNDEQDLTLVDLWCGGFMLAVDVFGEPWWSALLEESPEMLEPIITHAESEDLETVHDVASLKARAPAEAPAAIEAALDSLCDYFVPLREAAARARIETYRREEPKVGRNDPCPCGSGRKFKKCCGDATALH